jgi:hypothetical protein
MTMTQNYISPYRKAQQEFRGNDDGLWEYLEENKYDDPTLMLGWAFERAKRFFGYDQVTIAAKTGRTDGRGNVIEEPISKSFVSSMLSGQSRVSPEVYLRLADVCEVSVLDFHLAERWIRQSDIAAYSVPERQEAMPIIMRLLDIPRADRPKARAVVLSVLDSIYSLPPEPVAEEPAKTTKKKTTK